MLTLTCASGDSGRRLDRVLRRALPELPLSALHRLFRQRKITLNGHPAAAQTRVKAGDTIGARGQGAGGRKQELGFRSQKLEFDSKTLAASEIYPGSPQDFREKPNSQFPIPNSQYKTTSCLPIILETADLLILDKPAGALTHGKESLQSKVDEYLRGKIAPSLSFRSGPLHRLDRPTSGLVIFSKTLTGAQYVSGLMQKGLITKRYLALVEGVLREEAVWEDELLRDKSLHITRVVGKDAPSGGANAPTGAPSGGAGKPARTRALPLEMRHLDGRAVTLVRLEITGGRTHQIRVQAASHGHPLAGDRKYGGKRASLEGRQFFLHAEELVFPAEDRLPGLPQVVTTRSHAPDTRLSRCLPESSRPV